MSLVVAFRHKAAFALLLGSLAAPALAQDCAAQARAELTGHSSWGMGPISITNDQTAILERTSSGAGHDGDWIMTEWTVITTHSLADPLQRPATSLGVSEWNATCSGKQLSPTSVLSECKGRVPFFVANGKIAWTRGGATVGTIRGKTMTLNVLPDEGGFDWTMTGTVVDGGAPALSVDIVSVQQGALQPGAGVDFRDFTLAVRISPPSTDAVASLDASISGSAAATLSPVGALPDGKAWVLRLLGATPTQRATVAKATTFTASAGKGGCRSSFSRSVADVLSAGGQTP